jgi:hypothetical protein
MTNPDLAHPLDAVANQRHVVVGLTSEWRRSIGADAQTRAHLAGAVDRVVTLVRRWPPKNQEPA